MNEILNDEYDLVYSPDDGGWYIQRFPDHVCSVIYDTRNEALEALRRGIVRWDI